MRNNKQIVYGDKIAIYITLVIKYINARRLQWFKKSSVEGWKTSRQNGLYTNFMQRSSTRRLSWLHKGTPLGNGKKIETLFIFNGGSTPQKWNQVGQQDFKSCPTPKFISTYKNRMAGGTI